MLDRRRAARPGLQETRALRVWAGVRPLFDDKKAAGNERLRRHARRQPLARAARPPASATAIERFLTITGGKLTTYRLMAKDTVDAMVAQLGVEQALHDGGDGAARLRGRRRPSTSATACGRASRNLQDEQLICECEFVTRTAPRGGDPPPRLDEPRRPPPRAAPRHGPLPGRLLHLPRDRDPALGRPPRRRRGDQHAAPLPGGALEGRVADPLRRPAAPGAARRLDLPGRARRRAPARREPERRRRGREGRAAARSRSRYEVGRHRRRRRASPGSPPRSAPAESGKRVLVLAKGVGATHLSPADDRRARLRARSASSSPARSLAGFLADDPDHPYARLGATAIGAALEWFADLMAEPVDPYATGRPRGQPAAPQRGRRRRPPRSCR